QTTMALSSLLPKESRAENSVQGTHDIPPSPEPPHTPNFSPKSAWPVFKREVDSSWEYSPQSMKASPTVVQVVAEDFREKTSETPVPPGPDLHVAANSSPSPLIGSEHSAVTPPGPVAEQIGAVVSAHLEVVREHGPVVLHIHLDPPHLGRVSLHLTASDR